MTDHKPPFAVRYQHNGKTHGLIIDAKSWEDAEDRLRSIGASGVIVGSNARSYRLNSVTFAPVMLAVSLACWFRNLWRRP